MAGAACDLGGPVVRYSTLGCALRGLLCNRPRSVRNLPNMPAHPLQPYIRLRNRLWRNSGCWRRSTGLPLFRARYRRFGPFSAIATMYDVQYSLISWAICLQMVLTILDVHMSREPYRMCRDNKRLWNYVVHAHL